MQLTFALLDLRRLIHMAVLGAALMAAHMFGPPQIQAPMDQYLITPFVKTSTLLHHQFEAGAALVRSLGWSRGTSSE